MTRLDLNAARAARAEAGRERHEFIFGPDDTVFELPAELPAEFAFLLIENKALEALRVLLGGRFDEFWKLGPTVEDLQELTTGIAQLYSFVDVGESVASVPSSGNGGKSSRPTSPASTAKTSGKPATGGGR